MSNFEGKRVLDIGAGTGRLALAVAGLARSVYAVEPVARLRRYLLEQAHELGHGRVYAVDGLITEIPFEDRFSDITMAGHVFGDEPEREIGELERVTCRGGTVILCPGNSDVDNDSHAALTGHGYAWDRFEEPRDGMKRKYWKTI